MQSDKKLVLYDGSVAKWASETTGILDPRVFLVVQNDGNLVIYERTGRAIWASGTAGRG